MRKNMKKFFLFLMLLSVSLGINAAATATQIASGSNQQSNGKGFTYDHTTYRINTENAGDLATELANHPNTLPASDNQYNQLGMNYGAYFEFQGPINAADLASLSQFAAGSSYDVYFDFSNATFVDEDGNTVTDASIMSSLQNSKVKYVVLPNSTESIAVNDSHQVEGWPANITEAIAINESTNQFIGYATYDGSANGGAGTLEKLIAFDNRPYKNDKVTDYSLYGTYWHQEAKQQDGNYEDVLSLIMENYGWGECGLTNLDLTHATFPNYNEPSEKTITVTAETSDGTTKEFTYTYIEDNNGLASIHNYHQKIQSVKLPQTTGTTLIPNRAFDQCSLIKSMDIPDNFTTLGTAAFNQCDGIETLTFHKGLTEMGSNCFWKCKSLTSVALPVGLKNIGTYAFVECDALSQIVIPEGVERLETGCFEQTNISTVRLPNSLEYIDANAFRQCQNLTTITIPENVKEIGSGAFYNCKRITDVYFLGTTTIPKAAADAFESELYYHNKTIDEDKVQQPGMVTHVNYPEAAIQNNTSWQRGNVTLASYQEYDETTGEKINGAAVMHYPRIKVSPEYESTSWTAYQQALSDYNNALESNEEYQVWKNAVSKQYSRLYNGQYIEVSSEYIKEHPNETYYESSEFNWAQLWWNDTNVTTVYKLEDGEYIDITDQRATAAAPMYYKTYQNVQNASASDIAAIIAGEPEVDVKKPNLYVKNENNDYVEYTGDSDPGTDLFTMTQEGVDDLYGEYYTIPARNNNYGGTYVGSDEDNVLHSAVWPDAFDMQTFAGNGNSRSGLPTPDGTPAGTYDGLKNFLLAAGYPNEGEEQTPPVQVIDHIKKDVWYTMCFPFDLTNTQLESCFGAGYEVAQFHSVVDNGNGITLNFTKAVEADEKGVVTHKHVPYMIHPNSMAVNEDGTPKETVFTLTGIYETQDDHDADQEEMIKNAITVTAFDGTPFTFVGYAHNYQPGSVLIPRYAYFLATPKGGTYPKFYRETALDNRASGGNWNKNIAVVLPHVDKNDVSTYNFAKIDDRTIESETTNEDGGYKTLSEVWGEDEEGYYNYKCVEYVYQQASGVKSVLGNFDLQFINEPIPSQDEATAIEAVEKNDELNPAFAGKVFNISGQVVGTSLENLPKGIYIYNGKKYLVK